MRAVSILFYAFRLIVAGFAFLFLWPSEIFCTELTNHPAGQVVWWGKDYFWKTYYSNHTNGLVDCNDEFLTNAVSLAGDFGMGLALKNGGTVSAFGISWPGVTDIPAGLSNIVSVAVEGGFCWAIKRDGTVVSWPERGGENPEGANVVGSLTNIISIASAGAWNYLALQKNGTVFGFRLDNPVPRLSLIKVHGQILSNVVAMASMGFDPMILKTDGRLYSLSYQTPGKPPVEARYEVHDNVLYEYLGAESANLPYQYTAADPVVVNGDPVTNAVALASGGGHVLVLKKDGTVVALGEDTYGAKNVPSGLDHVIAISAAEHESLALKDDGTVVAWGADYNKQIFVPAGLSNVVAIACGEEFNLAITTGNIPSSVFIQPHGHLEELEQKADVVFKGQVISSTRMTNSAFTVSQMEVNSTRFKVVAALKGKVFGEVEVQHYFGWGNQMFIWDGPAPPAKHDFQPGRCYLIFATDMDKPDDYYSPPAGTKALPNIFHLIDDGVLKTLNGRATVARASVKEACWNELNLLLNDLEPTNVLYAIDKLDEFSCKSSSYERQWHGNGDFDRRRFLQMLLPLIENKNDRIAIRVLRCFETESNAAVMLEPFANSLIDAANSAPSSTRRLAAIRALSGIDGGAVSNSLVQLLNDKDEDVRVGAVRLLLRFPADFAGEKLKNSAKDFSPKVRAAVADAIGNGKVFILLPVLEMLWEDTNVVHTSAGNALLKFDVEQVGGFLKSHLNNAEFNKNFLCQLARNDTKPWVANLVQILADRRAAKWAEAKTSGITDVANYFNALMNLSGPDYECWNIIHDYLVKLPASEFEQGRLDWCLDALEDAGNTGSREPVMLYQLYKAKGLKDRAATFRRENGKCTGFDMTVYFDNADKEDSGSK